MFLGFALQIFISVGLLETPCNRDRGYADVLFMACDSTKKEKARKQAIAERKKRYGCVIPDHKKNAAAKKRQLELQKKN